MATLLAPAPIANLTDSEPEYRPTADFGFAPSAFDAAFWTGFNLGLDREDASAPADSTPNQTRAFTAGWVAGNRQWENRLEEMYRDAFEDGRTT